MTIKDLIDKAAAELVKEILACEEGRPWFYVIQRKMQALADALKKRRKK